MHQNRRHLSGYKEVWSFLISAYGQRCVYCRKNIATQIDHVIPYSYSCYHGLENLRPCCAWCNLTASDKVFDSFDQKLLFIRAEIKRKHKRLFTLSCSNCLLPYYSALCKSFVFCPRCYAKEYDLPYLKTDAWKEWLNTLFQAGISYRAHFHLSDKIDEHKIQIPLKDKIEIIVDYASRHDDQFDRVALAEELENRI